MLGIEHIQRIELTQHTEPLIQGIIRIHHIAMLTLTMPPIALIPLIVPIALMTHIVILMVHTVILMVHTVILMVHTVILTHRIIHICLRYPQIQLLH